MRRTPTLFPYTTLFRSRDVSIVVRSLPASGPQALTVRASAEDGALLAREPATIAPDEASVAVRLPLPTELRNRVDRKSTRLNSSHVSISYAVFCLKKKK